MKVKVADLEPNPFRDFDSYAIDRERIEGLKDSMDKDEFWGGIPVRPHPTKKGKYQIGGGHHRLISLQENNVKEIDITAIHNYSDARMLRIMINENAQYAARPKLVNSDIEKAKKLLDDLLDKYKTWEKAKCDSDITLIFKNSQGFGKAKKDKAGRRTILDYLGKPWAHRGWMIQAALATLKAEKKGLVDREAVETIPTIDQADQFRRSIEKHKIPKPRQKKIAKQIVDEGTTSKQIPDLVAEHSILPVKKEKAKPKELPMLDDLVDEISKTMAEIYTKLCRVKDHFQNIQSGTVRRTFISEGTELKNLLCEIFKDSERSPKNGKKKKAKKAKVVG